MGGCPGVQILKLKDFTLYLPTVGKRKPCPWTKGPVVPSPRKAKWSSGSCRAIISGCMEGWMEPQSLHCFRCFSAGLGS